MVQTGSLAGTTGRIVSYTIIYVPTPEFAGESPYGLAVIEAQDGTRLLARIKDATTSNLAVGAPVAYDHDDEHGAVFRVTEG